MAGSPDQTVQWAREALRARRNELRERKRELISAYQDEDASASTSAGDAHAMLERGRRLLAEAEAHSKILGQYAAAGESRDVASYDAEADRTDEGPSTKDEPFLSRFLQETSQASTCGSTTNSPRVVPQLPVEAPGWNDGSHDEDEDGSLREGEARQRLDELIAAVRRQDEDDPLRDVALDETPEKRVSNFDPSSLKAARRAALRQVQRDEELAAAEAEARRLTSFKARPLPSGAEVKSDLFASTQAFQGKQLGSVEKLVRRDTKYDPRNDASSSVSGTLGTYFDGLSMVSSRTSHDNSFDCAGYETEADRERAKQLRAEKKAKKRQLLDAVNRMLVDDTQMLGEDNDAMTVTSQGWDVVEDPSKLRQDIARLEAKLKQKKTERLATLNDIVDIDLNALFDRLLTGDADDDARHIIDRLKDRVCGGVNDFRHSIALAVKEDDIAADEPKRPSLFERQEEWARRREQKLFNARLQTEAEAMDGITGRPEVSHATRSWRKAKESHDETLKLFAEEEGRKHREREAKEKAASEAKAKEMEELQREANSKLKSLKSEVDKEEQRKRLEMLSRPRQIREGPGNVDSETDVAVCDEHRPEPKSKSKIFLSATPKKKPNPTNGQRSKPKPKTEAVINSTSISSQKPDEFCGKPSFSELTDKDFARLVKRIERKALAKAQEQQDVLIIGGPEALVEA